MRSDAGVSSVDPAADSVVSSRTASSREGNGERSGSPGSVRIGVGFGGSNAKSSFASAMSLAGDLDVLGRRFFCNFRVVGRVGGDALAIAEASTLLARRFETEVEGRRSGTGEL